MSAYLCPLFNEPESDANGNPLSGGKIFTYAAGSTTPATTYTSSAGTVPQANPVILNSRGVPDSPLWLAGGTSYKFVLQDANGVTLSPTFDNVQGINDPSATTAQDQWVALPVTPTFLSATTFSVPGDQTATLQVGRRLKSTNSGGTVHSTITAATFATVTTVTVISDSSASLDSGLSAVSYGLLSASNPSLPQIKYPAPNNRVINGACLVSQYGTTALTNGAVTYGGCDRIGFAVTATTASGTLSQQSPAVAGIGTYGKVQSSTITTTGSTTIFWFTRLEGKHVRDMGGQSVIFACNVYQNTGSTLSFAPTIRKANTVDNFGATTTLAIGPTTQVPSGVATTVFMRTTLNAGDADNGLELVVNATAFNFVTSKRFDCSDVYLGIGSSQLEYQMVASDVSTELLRCQRYFWTPQNIATGLQVSATAAVFSLPAPVLMRATPTLATISGSPQLTVGGTTAAIAGTWTTSSIGPGGVVVQFTRTAGTWTAGDAIILNDAAAAPCISLKAEL
jgi:hypothetical protein